MKFFYFINTLLHLIFGITIFIITLVAAFSIDDITKSSETGSFLGKSHKSLGLALVYLMITIVSIGITSKLSMLCWRHLTLWIKLIKIIHAVMGYLVTLKCLSNKIHINLVITIYKIFFTRNQVDIKIDLKLNKMNKNMK